MYLLNSLNTLQVMFLVDLATTVPIYMPLLATLGKLWDVKHQK